MEAQNKIRSGAEARRNRFGGTWLTAFAALALAALVLGGLLYWSASSTDELAHAREQRLVDSIVTFSAARIGHDQESVTVRDDAILELRKKPLDMEWLDNNLGGWLHFYFSHDAAYVLDPANRPVYAMVEGATRPPSAFAGVQDAALPLVAELRAKMRKGGEKLPANLLSPGASDILVANGHPAVVSVKPIVSDSGKIAQVPGKEFVHVSIRRLDGTYIDRIRSSFAVDGARFSWSGDHRADERAEALRSRNGQPAGYLIWKPFAPGSKVLKRLAPSLLIIFLLIAALVMLLLGRVASRTRQLTESRAAVHHLAFHDPLTGLPNRVLFEDRLDHALAIYRGTAEHRVALLYLDLDRFKQVNDTLGHPAGDELIREFARRISTIIRVTDTAARLGGDEFAIIQTEVSSLAETEGLCRRLVEAATTPFLIGGSQVFVGVSIGVALAGKDGFDAVELTRKADIALYESKAHGRGRHKFFQATMDEPIRARLAAEHDLRAAIEAGDQLSVVYQPQYSAITGEMSGAEALVRWEHPTNGSVPPSVFIPVAEEAGLIDALGEWVMTEACQAAGNWPGGTVSINISSVQLRNPHFAYRTIGIISDSGIDPTRVELEISETALTENSDVCSTNLRLLRAFDVRIALDDFGTGYSSFAQFRDLEVDRVKIDRSFVDKINVGAGGSAIIRAIVDLARSTGLQTTAEGVETDEQREFLQAIGCNELQGFFMARPMQASDIGAMLAAAPMVARTASEKPKAVPPPRPRHNRRAAG